MIITASGWLNGFSCVPFAGKTVALVVGVCAIAVLLLASIIMCYAWKRRSRLKRKQGMSFTWHPKSFATF